MSNPILLIPISKHFWFLSSLPQHDKKQIISPSTDDSEWYNVDDESEKNKQLSQA